MGPVRVLGIDPGGKRLGLAVGDTTTGIATPLEVVFTRGLEDAAAKIAAVMANLDADRVIIGLPTDVDGRETPACRRSHALARALAQIGVLTMLQPEHLSTDEARRRARGLRRRPTLPVDDLAAQVILEEFFEGLAHGSPSP
jgi:putative Holliday junction resolvase